MPASRTKNRGPKYYMKMKDICQYINFINKTSVSDTLCHCDVNVKCPELNQTQSPFGAAAAGPRVALQ